MQHASFWGTSLMVAGTCIGAGMLGLPVALAQVGLPTILLVFLLAWALMTLSAWCMLEVVLHHPDEVNVISLAKRHFGPLGALGIGGLYIAFHYVLMAAYVMGTGALLHTWGPVAALGSVAWGQNMAVVALSALLIFGVAWVDRCNRLFMFGLLIAYVGLISTAAPALDTQLMMPLGQPSTLLPFLPLVVLSFGYHLLLPSLCSYTRRQTPLLKRAVICGGGLSLVIYMLWMLVVLGLVPVHGEDGLLALAAQQDAVAGLTQTMARSFPGEPVTLCVTVFGACALLTSFFGVSLSLFDFMADAFNSDKQGRARWLLAAVVFVPPWLLVNLPDQSFLGLLNVWGGSIGVLLLVLFPAACLWRQKNAPLQVLTPCIRQAAIPVLFLVGMAVLALEIAL